jgi:hypothetical protein
LKWLKQKTFEEALLLSDEDWSFSSQSNLSKTRKEESASASAGGCGQKDDTFPRTQSTKYPHKYTPKYPYRKQQESQTEKQGTKRKAQRSILQGGSICKGDWREQSSED